VAEPAVVPAPPPAAVVMGATPQERAVSLDALVGAGNASDPLGGWIAVYEQLGIPVLDAQGVGLSATTADDPVGPAYDLVWMLAPTSTSPAGIPLTDLVRAYIDDDQPAGELADALLADLRASAVSADPAVALFGNLVRERALKTGPGSDLLDPLTVAGDLYVDAATAQLISWVTIRAMTAVAAAGSTAVLGLRAAPVAVVQAPAAGSAAPCSEIWGTEDTTFWVNWFANKIVGGVQLPGMTKATKGLIEALSGLNPGIISSNAAEKFGKVTKVTNLVTGLLSLILAVSTVKVDAVQNPDPLERTKSSRQAGKTTELTWAVSIDIGNLPDGNQQLVCATSFVLNTLGVSFTVPANGALPGVDLTFEGRLGFGERLNTAGSFVTLDMKELKKTSDSKGMVHTTVTGMAQRRERDFPESAKPILREFSIDVAAQVEPENLNSLLNVFFDGLTFGANPDGYGLAAGAVDIARTLHWDMGERVFRLKDWQAGWKIDQYEFDNHFTGIVCDLAKPFAVDFESPIGGWQGRFTVTPTPDGPATWAFEGTIVSAYRFVGTGVGEVQSPQNAEAVVVIRTSSDWVADVPEVGPRPIDIAAAFALPTVSLVLQPLDTDECLAG
jgi:hypothetical protein